MRDGVVDPRAYCTDNNVGIWYEGTEAVRVVADRPMDPVTGPAGYLVELVNGDVVETRVAVGERF